MSAGPLRTCPGLFGYSLSIPLSASRANADACSLVRVTVGLSAAGSGWSAVAARRAARAVGLGSRMGRVHPVGGAEAEAYDTANSAAANPAGPAPPGGMMGA